MLARYLRSHCSRVKYAGGPESPLSLLVRSRLLAQPMQQYDMHLPYWGDHGGTTGHLPGLFDAIHQGHHQRFPELIGELIKWTQAAHSMGFGRGVFPSEELLHAMHSLYLQRAGLPEHHPLTQAYTPGSLADAAGNQYGQYHMNAALRTPRTGHALEALTTPDRRMVLGLLQPLRKGAGTLPGVLHAHQQIRDMMVNGPASFPIMDLMKMTSGVIGKNIAAREHVGQLGGEVDWRPNETIPEDYHALGRPGFPWRL